MFNECAIVDTYDESPAALYNSKMIKARKEHKCCECYSTIRPGECYENVRANWEGTWTTIKTCRTCVNVRKSLFRNGFIHEALIENLEECYGIDFYLEPPDPDEDDSAEEEWHIEKTRDELRKMNGGQDD